MRMGDADIHIHSSDKKRLQALETFLTQFLFITPSSRTLSSAAVGGGAFFFNTHGRTKIILHYSLIRHINFSVFREIYSDKAYSKWRTGYDYPQNHLRNIARDNSLTQYTISLDVDVIIAPQMTRYSI